MEPDQTENQNDGSLVAETLVEEVSIDGMCGVY
jgi:mycofactocin precursor